MKTWGVILLTIAGLLIGGAIIFGAITLSKHSTQLDCLTTSVNQALNEAFHHAHLEPPTCKP